MVRANNVVIRNARISCASPTEVVAVRVAGTSVGLVIEDSEIDGRNIVQVGVGYSGYSLRRVEVRNTNDGLRMATNASVQDSWIHDMTRMDDLHPDAIQSTGGSGIVIRHNTLAPRNTTTGDRNNAAIMLGSEQAPGLTDVLIEDNVLSGGNMTVNVRGDTVIRNVVLSRNTFNGGSRYGPMQAPASVQVGPSNILASTGLPITVKIVS
jgi:hypothetical protein